MTFNVHLAQFHVAPIRTRAGISLIRDSLINCKVCDVTLGGVGSLRNVTTFDKGIFSQFMLYKFPGTIFSSANPI